MTVQTAHTESVIKQALKILKGEGIDRIKVDFSGGGDSGQIDAVNYYVADQNVTNKYHSSWTYEDGKRVTTPAEKTMPIIKGWSRNWIEEEGRYGYTPKLVESSVAVVLENHVYDALDGSGIDWYNSGGGQGTYELYYDDDDDKWTYAFVVDVNYIEVVTEHSVEGTIGEEDEE